MPEPIAATLNVAGWPVVTLWLAGCFVMDGAAMPVPLSEMVKLEFNASLATTRLPLIFPVACGANWIWNPCDCPAAMETEDIPPTRLNPAPVTVALEIVIVVVPVFVRVKVCVLFKPGATFPKVKFVALAASVPAGVLVEPVFAGAPALVKPTQPEMVKVITSIIRIANKASGLRCFGNCVATA